MPLFNARAVEQALAAWDRIPTYEELSAATEWAHRCNELQFELQNESQLEQEFNRIVVQDVLGYAAPSPGKPGTMRVKQPIPGGTVVDVALGSFDGDQTVIRAPLELKGPKIPLDRIMPGRNKTPIQQAWDYAMDTPGARWVLITNMRDLRLYAVGYGRLDYESFDLRQIAHIDELRRLQLVLRADRLLTGDTTGLLLRSMAADRDITNALYRDYRELREDLLQFVRDQHPGINGEMRIAVVQKLLDRLLFIAFAEDSFLLPPNVLKKAVEFHNPYESQPKWHQLRRVFEWVDKGATDQNIPPYNGGLFRHDPLLDSLALPDPLVERIGKLAQYDYRSEISVTILGHIFEQSISDIEEKLAEVRNETPTKTGKRKREGVVYTPDFVTRFIVEQTIGRTLAEISESLLPRFGKTLPNREIKWRSRASEREYWQTYLDRLASLRIVDPACGSGAFLVAAFDLLYAEQQRVRARLSEFGPGLLVHASDTADVEIITGNLFGVDVNAESVEITKLALWLKTARRNRRLESLDANIRHGNSLIADRAAHSQPFDWRAEFPDIFSGEPSEGFDIVIGNPPYVRMEHLKAIKPYLESRYDVSADRADLYAYFFELGFELLKPGGRLGYISSSTFFRTGSGEPLRAFLSANAEMEAVIDFGDLQVFEGVTTYPAIVVLRKPDGPPTPSAGELRYLNVRAMPNELTKTFDEEAMAMPRRRLTPATWRFENRLLDAIRAKIAEGRPSLAEVCGPPLYGIKTGLNAAFVLNRGQRDAIVERAEHYGDRSEDLLKPYLIGENLKRWHVQSDDLWLIYTPKNRIDIDDYPALREHLAPFQERLEKRSTNQNWWELQQAQADYESYFLRPKIIYSDITNKSTFSIERNGAYPANTCYVIPSDDAPLTGYLNSRVVWFYLAGLTNIAQGGYLRLRSAFVGRVPIPGSLDAAGLTLPVEGAHEAASKLYELKIAGRHRLRDIASNACNMPTLLEWPSYTFAELQAELLKRCRSTILVAERDQWERWFNDRKREATNLASRISDAEAEIDDRVSRLFGLNGTEVSAIEDSLAVTSPVIGLKGFEAISAVEGLELSDEARGRVAARG